MGIRSRSALHTFEYVVRGQGRRKGDRAMAFLRVNLTKLKTMVVDDSRTARLMLAEMLREMGVSSIAKAEDGADAMQQLQEFAADVVICDLHMTPLDGIEFTRLLRTADDSPNPYLPVLMLTGDATQKQLGNALNAGAHGFMSKPLQADSLRRQINLVFSRPLVFIREGRELKPVTLPKRQDDGDVQCASAA